MSAATTCLRAAPVSWALPTFPVSAAAGLDEITALRLGPLGTLMTTPACIVAGGGPGGMLLACLLARAGGAVTLLARAHALPAIGVSSDRLPAAQVACDGADRLTAVPAQRSRARLLVGGWISRC